MNPFLVVIPGIIGAILTTSLFIYGVFNVARKKGPTIVGIARNFLYGIRAPKLARAKKNPLIAPSGHSWEAEAVMNPGAAMDDDGKVHLFYRAIGSDGVSRIGYASSQDGTNFEDRLPYPVFALKQQSRSERELRAYRERYHPGLVASGGGWSGTEDPRAVIIDDRLYLSFQAFEGWDSLRIGITSLSLEDLKAKKWAWTAPIFLSAPGDVQKNWVIFPKKFGDNGDKYAIFHGLEFQNRNRASIAYLDSLDADPTPYLQSNASFRDERYPDSWDNCIRGAATPPIETKEGWLLFYHANDSQEPHKYKVGAMLLSLTDPSQVLARSKAPVLAPDADYENEGAKPGVVYACGAIVKDGMLIIYYGAADSTVSAAAAPLDEFLTHLLHPDTGSAMLDPLPA